MRIGIDCRLHSPHFGIGRYTHELVSRLLTLDKDVTYVLFTNSQNPLFPGAKNVKEIVTNIQHYSVREQVAFIKILRDAKLDLMHFTHFNAPVLFRGKSVVTIHDLILHFFPGKKIRSFFKKKSYEIVMKAAVKNAAKIIAVSKYTKDDLVSHLHVPANKITVVYEAASDIFRPVSDTSAIEDAKQRFGLSSPFILYAGGYRSHKNIPRLLEGFALAIKTLGINAKLVLVGTIEGPTQKEISRIIENNSLRDSVVFTGALSDTDLVSLMNGAQVFIFPSLYEGFGLPPLEAMQCGTVVCASNTTSIPEICGRNNTFFFNPYDLPDMAEAIRESFTNIETRKTMKERGLKRAAEFSWAKTAEQTFAVYEDAFGRRIR